MSDTPLQEFIAETGQRSIARTNRFYVEISNILAGNETFGPIVPNWLNFYCEKAELPSLNIESNTQLIFGEARDLPYNRSFNSFSLTFYVDKKLEIKRYFDKWADSIIDRWSRVHSYYNNYARKITVTCVDESTVPYGSNMNEFNFGYYTMELYECWPKTIQHINLSSRDNTPAMSMTVTFNYKYYWVLQEPSRVPLTAPEPSKNAIGPVTGNGETIIVSPSTTLK